MNGLEDMSSPSVDKHLDIFALLRQLFTGVLAFLLGKNYAEKRQFKRQHKLLQQWRKNKYKSLREVGDSLRKGKFVILLGLWWLVGCTSVPLTVCPPLVEYTSEEQLQLAQLLEQSRDELLKRYIFDYGNLRAKLQQCQ